MYKYLLTLSLCLLGVNSMAIVDVLPKTGEQMSLKRYKFKDDDGKEVKLSDYVRPGIPLIIVPVYFECPGVCTLTLNDLFHLLEITKIRPGTQIEVVALSINPDENPTMAKEKKNNYLDQYKMQFVDYGVHFLTGNQSNIDEFTEDFGFLYERQGDVFNHAQAIYVLSSDEVITSLLKKSDNNPKYFKTVLWNAAGGKTMSSYQNFLIRCTNYLKSVTEGDGSVPWWKKLFKNFSNYFKL